MARLVVVDGPDKGATHGLNEEVTLGRTTDCGVRLMDVTVSRRHAKIERAGAGYVLIPLTLSNITALNDAPVSDRVPIKDGDLIRLGGSVLRLSTAISPPPAGLTLADAKSYEEIVRSVPASDLPFDTAPHLRSLDEAERFVSALQAINGIARAVAAILEVDELLERIMEMSLDIYGSARRAMIMMLEPGTHDPGRIVFRRKKQGDKREIVISKKVLTEVVELQRAVLSRDATDDDRFKNGLSIAMASVRAMMCAPLVFRGEILGVLYIDSDSPGAFDDKDLEMLAGIAAQSATALGVAKLHQEVLRRERLERDLKLAENIQKSFVPATVPEVQGWSFAVEYRPARGVSGDYYDFLRLPSGAFAIVIADVMGKGLGAALHMARLTRDLRHAATFAEDPAWILARLNEASKDLEQSNAFVTMTVIVVEPGSAQIRFSSAGHGPLLVRGAAEGQVHALDPEPASAIGMFDDSEFVTTHHQVSPGDTLVLFTDGVVEATSPGGEMLGLEGLATAITKGESSAEAVLRSVISSTDAYVGRGAQGDDITVVTMTFQA
ncbi:MAG: SpoIIE family protein phosphatase [Myxococcota bacterium]